MSEVEYKLNHPWSIYFQEPISSYTKYSVYYIELLKLLDFFKNLTTFILNLKSSSFSVI